jgi:hypothetical protein
VMIRRALDTLPSVVEGFLCRETDVSYVLKPDTVSPTSNERDRHDVRSLSLVPAVPLVVWSR